MTRVLIVSLLCMMLITACTPGAAPTEEPSEPAEIPTEASVPPEPPAEAVPVGPAEEAVIKQLAGNLGLQESDITLVSSDETEFSDGCLEVAMEGVMCTQVITPGRIIVLEADGIQYEYHTNEDRSRVQPAMPALVWKREGGIAGFCDILTVFRSGEVFATNCKQTEGKMGTLASLLSAQERQKFNTWITEYGEVKLDESDPQGVADRMVVTLEFFGTGEEAPTEADQQGLFKFAQDLYKKLSK